MLKLGQAMNQVAEMLARKQFDAYMGGGNGRPRSGGDSAEILALVYGVDKSAVEDNIFFKQRAALDRLENDHKAG